MNPRTRYVVQQARDETQRRIAENEGVLRALSRQQAETQRDLDEDRNQLYALDESLREDQ